MTVNEVDREERAATVEAGELRELVERGEIELIDVRTEHEWRAGHLPGARHVELNHLPSAAGDLPAAREIVIYCQGGNRSRFAVDGLRAAGYSARSLEGGALAWAGAGLGLEPADGYIAESGEAAAELEARKRAGNRPPGIEY